MKQKTMWIWLLLAPLVLAALLGLVFAAIDSGGDFIAGWWGAASGVYVMFCAPAHVAWLLTILFRFEIDHAYGFGLALYYGTIFLGKMISNLMGLNEGAYVLAFVIVSLLCYIYWLKNKPEE